MRPLLFLLKLAWDSRFRLPLLLTVGFLVLDVRMQLDINVQTRRVPRTRRPPPRMNPIQESTGIENAEVSSSSSWTTEEESEVSAADF